MVTDAIADEKWILDIDYDMNTNLIADIVQSCVLLQETTMTEEADSIKWVLSADGKHSARSAYNA
jgi:hypothetical protein